MQVFSRFYNCSNSAITSSSPLHSGVTLGLVISCLGCSGNTVRSGFLFCPSIPFLWLFCLCRAPRLLEDTLDNALPIPPAAVDAALVLMNGWAARLVALPWWLEDTLGIGNRSSFPPAAVLVLMAGCWIGPWRWFQCPVLLAGCWIGPRRWLLSPWNVFFVVGNSTSCVRTNLFSGGSLVSTPGCGRTMAMLMLQLKINLFETSIFGLPTPKKCQSLEYGNVLDLCMWHSVMLWSWTICKYTQ